MPYLTGVLTGILLTILVLFVIDNFGSDARPIVNWSVLSEKLGAAKEEERKEGNQPPARPPSRARQRQPRPTDFSPRSRSHPQSLIRALHRISSAARRNYILTTNSQ